MWRTNGEQKQNPCEGHPTLQRYIYMDFYTDEENELVTTKTTVTKLYTSIHINWYQYGEHTVSLNA